MQLRQRLESQPETLLDFISAAEQRYREAIELAIARRTTTAIYIMGYTAEMVLKVAALRFDGASGGTAVQPRLPLIRRWMVARHPNLSHEGFHSLIFWLQYLRTRQKDDGRTFERNLDGALVHHVQRVYFTWWVGMRYQPYKASPFEIKRVFADVTWVWNHRLEIWR